LQKGRVSAELKIVSSVRKNPSISLRGVREQAGSGIKNGLPLFYSFPTKFKFCCEELKRDLKILGKSQWLRELR
jgi:hypothetical protein